MKRLLKAILSLLARVPAPAPPLRRPHEPAPIEQKADLQAIAVARAQDEAAARNVAKRRAQKMAQFAAWSDRKAVEERRQEHEKSAAEALERGKLASRQIREQLGLPPEDPPLPPLEDLPPGMRAQAPSTIRAMLRQEGWQFQSDGWKPPKLQGIKIVENPPCPWRAPTDETATPAQRKARAMMGLKIVPTIDQGTGFGFDPIKDERG